ncbi:unnamed protein product [Staurois parvus]|uniref:SAP30-binding protein n=1 Tax=Staurois parvus TaxID=386267 RepID=A0ABN9GES2_9NEOB|nr:unnamed protein product [Staurois parvus]
MSPDDIKIPPEPPGRCSNHLQEKIHKLYERKLKEGTDMNQIIQKKKEFRNPSIYEKLIQFCSIDELGTNYPKDMFDPHGWAEDSYYEALAKAQKIEMDKLEKAKKERTKIEFVTGTKKGTTTHINRNNQYHNYCHSRCTEKEKQMGLRYTDDYYCPANNPHHNCHTAFCCHSNYQCKWIKNYGHFCCGDYCEEG